MALNLKPISGTANRVIVEPAAAEEKTASGIYIPDTAKEKPSKGTVVSVSEEDSEGKKPTVKVGDVVIYGKYGGTEFPYEGKDYLIMRETDIYAVVSLIKDCKDRISNTNHKSGLTKATMNIAARY